MYSLFENKILKPLKQFSEELDKNKECPDSLQLAQQYYDDKKYEDSLEILNSIGNFSTLQPLSLALQEQVEYLKIRCCSEITNGYMKEHQFEEASKFLAKLTHLISLYPYSTEESKISVKIMRCYILQALGNDFAAKKEIDDLNLTYQDHTQILVAKAQIYTRQGFYEDAEGICKELNSHKITTETEQKISVILASIYYNKGEYEEALRGYNCVLDKNQNHVSAIIGKTYLYMRYIYFKSSKHSTENIQHLSTALRIANLSNYEKALIYHALGETCLAVNPQILHPKEGAVYLLKALKIRKDDKRLLGALGYVYHLLNDIEKSKSLYSQALEPDSYGKNLLHIDAKDSVFFENVERYVVLLGYAKDINIQDIYGNTPLHYAVQSRNFKIAALLILKNSDLNIINKASKSALDLAIERNDYEMITYIAYAAPQQESLRQLKPLNGVAINKYRGKFSSKNQIFSLQNLAHRLAENTSSVQSLQNFDVKNLELLYNELLKVPEIYPILDIVRLATYGYHDLGKVVVEINKEYKLKKEKLTWCIDTESDLVDQQFFNELSTVGVCNYGTNIIGVGKASRNPLDVRGTLVHEMTYFVTQEVYKNHCKPYFSYDEKRKEEFDKICNRLHEKRNSLHTVLKAVFDHYKKEYWHSELIVRVPHLIAQTQSDNIVSEQCPELLKYYREIFLVDCQKHLQALKNKISLHDDNCLTIYYHALFDKQPTKDKKEPNDQKTAETPTNPPYSFWKIATSAAIVTGGVILASSLMS